MSHRWGEMIVLVAVLAAVACGRSNYEDPNGEQDLALNCSELAGDRTYAGENGHCYTLHMGPSSFEDAAEACVDLGGNLLTLSSPEEEQDVLTGLSLDTEAWVGLESGGGWHWRDGSSLIYSNWLNPPDTGDLFRGFISAQGWTSGRVQQLAFICEYAWTSAEPESGLSHALFTHSVTFQAARQRCMGFGGDLASLPSPELKAAVSQLSKTEPLVGLQKDDAGDYLWLTGEPLDVQDWAVNQPYAPFACARYNPDTGLLSENCSVARYFLCAR